MVYQHESGVPLRVENIAAEDIPFYRFVEINPKEGFLTATGKYPLVGVSLPEIDEYVRKTDGTIQKRGNKYFKGEIPRILRFGVCYIESDEELNVGDAITVGKEGKANKNTIPLELITVENKKSKTTGTESNDDTGNNLAELHLKIKGMALDKKLNRGNVVRVALNFNI